MMSTVVMIAEALMSLLNLGRSTGRKRVKTRVPTEDARRLVTTVAGRCERPRFAADSLSHPGESGHPHLVQRRALQTLQFVGAHIWTHGNICR